VSQTGAPAAELTSFVCQRDVQPKLRAVSVTAVMRPVSGTRRMRLRFDLLSSSRRNGRYHAVHGPNLGRWVSPGDPALGSRPGDVWQVPHPIVGLDAPAFYKIRVGFRWLGRDRRVLARQSLVSAVCHQLELRPDLVARSLTITPSATVGEDNYVAAVRDAGVTGAGPFNVQVALADGTAVSHQIFWLGAHRTRQLNLLANACAAGSAVTLTVDSTGQVDDYDRANNVLTVVCPSG
jgi:hypothetical protein